jgi:hypothetical protein
MLTTLEHKVVDDLKILHFGAHLQYQYICYSSLIERLIGVRTKEKLDSKEELLEMIDILKDMMQEFDYCYFYMLPRQKVNPLIIEQESWKLLSPKIKQYLNNFKDYVQKYSFENIDKEKLLFHINTGWKLIQQWNLISDSYKVKHQKSWNFISEREEALKELYFRRR